MSSRTQPDKTASRSPTRRRMPHPPLLRRQAMAMWSAVAARLSARPVEARAITALPAIVDAVCDDLSRQGVWCRVDSGPYREHAAKVLALAMETRPAEAARATKVTQQAVSQFVQDWAQRAGSCEAFEFSKRAGFALLSGDTSAPLPALKTTFADALAQVTCGEPPPCGVMIYRIDDERDQLVREVCLDATGGRHDESVRRLKASGEIGLSVSDERVVLVTDLARSPVTFDHALDLQVGRRATAYVPIDAQGRAVDRRVDNGAERPAYVVCFYTSDTAWTEALRRQASLDHAERDLARWSDLQGIGRLAAEWIKRERLDAARAPATPAHALREQELWLDERSRRPTPTGVQRAVRAIGDHVVRVGVAAYSVRHCVSEQSQRQGERERSELYVRSGLGVDHEAYARARLRTLCQAILRRDCATTPSDEYAFCQVGACVAARPVALQEEFPTAHTFFSDIYVRAGSAGAPEAARDHTEYVIPIPFAAELAPTPAASVGSASRYPLGVNIALGVDRGVLGGLVEPARSFQRAMTAYARAIVEADDGRMWQRMHLVAELLRWCLWCLLHQDPALRRHEAFAGDTRRELMSVLPGRGDSEVLVGDVLSTWAALRLHARPSYAIAFLVAPELTLTGEPSGTGSGAEAPRLGDVLLERIQGVVKQLNFEVCPGLGRYEAHIGAEPTRWTYQWSAATRRLEPQPGTLGGSPAEALELNLPLRVGEHGIFEVERRVLSIHARAWSCDAAGVRHDALGLSLVFAVQPAARPIVIAVYEGAGQSALRSLVEGTMSCTEMRFDEGHFDSLLRIDRHNGGLGLLCNLGSAYRLGGVFRPDFLDIHERWGAGERALDGYGDDADLEVFSELGRGFLPDLRGLTDPALARSLIRHGFTLVAPSGSTGAAWRGVSSNARRLSGIRAWMAQAVVVPVEVPSGLGRRRYIVTFYFTRASARRAQDATLARVRRELHEVVTAAFREHAVAERT